LDMKGQEPHLHALLHASGKRVCNIQMVELASPGLSGQRTTRSDDVVDQLLGPFRAR